MICVIIWGIVRIRVKCVPRIIMPPFFLAFCGIVISATYCPKDSIIARGLIIDSVGMQLLNVYALNVMLLSYCDFRVCLFLNSPMYVVT